MKYPKPKIGDRFGRLVIRRLFRKPTRFWAKLFCDCVCDCGTRKEFLYSNLQQGITKSCGCLKLENLITRSVTHGHNSPSKGRTIEYNCWSGMKNRCKVTSTVNPDRERYAGRGISVCKRWETSFEHFLKDMGRCPTGKSLDRIDNDGNYEPGNCRWATPKEQARNTRRNVKLTHNGETLCASEWAIRLHTSCSVLVRRLHRGWSMDEIFTIPIGMKKSTFYKRS